MLEPEIFDITHKEHIICNPPSLEKYQQLINLLRLPPDANVLEIATGKGEFIIRLAEQYSVNGVGVGISPYFVRDARVRLAGRAPQANIPFLEMDGADYRPDEPESFDLTVCIGASWIFDGHKGTLAALKAMTKPGGLIVAGEPYWLQEPEPAYLKTAGFERDLFGNPYENVLTGQEMGLSPLYTLVRILMIGMCTKGGNGSPPKITPWPILMTPMCRNCWSVCALRRRSICNGGGTHWVGLFICLER